ncbi:MAG: VWA domain-containing protein [Geminicoccaceae bacterium]
MSKHEIARQGGAAEIADFVERMRRLPAAGTRSGQGRLMFALDATASRERTWDLACQVQNEMFVEAGRHGGLAVQLLFYRGFAECKASPWLHEGQDLVRLMRAVRCVAGKTQIHRVLRHAIGQARSQPVQALVFVGDCMEEDTDALGQLAGELGLLGTRMFLFHEGQNAAAERCFRQLAGLTRGAYCRFASGAAAELAALLAGVAAYAAGGAAAVAALPPRTEAVRLLQQQLR